MEKGKSWELFKRIIRAVLCLVLLYVASYVVNSMAGGWMYNESGKTRNRITSLAVFDQFIWVPRLGFCQTFQSVGGRNRIRADYSGYVYCPLILFDQTYVHKTIPCQMEEYDKHAPPKEEMHPLIQRAMENPDSLDSWIEGGLLVPES